MEVVEDNLSFRAGIFGQRRRRVLSSVDLLMIFQRRVRGGSPGQPAVSRGGFWITAEASF